MFHIKDTVFVMFIILDKATAITHIKEIVINVQVGYSDGLKYFSTICISVHTKWFSKYKEFVNELFDIFFNESSKYESR